MRPSNQQKGFTLLYALLVISVVLMVTASIFSILLKEMRISSFGKASQIAYYAAESGAECAVYWAASGTNFNGATNIQCHNQNVTASSPFIVNVGSEGACAIVTVDQSSNTTIESRGYNVCPGSGPSARRVERGLQIVF